MGEDGWRYNNIPVRIWNERGEWWEVWVVVNYKTGKIGGLKLFFGKLSNISASKSNTLKLQKKCL